LFHGVLTSPVDGIVQELAVHTVDGVVTEAKLRGQVSNFPLSLWLLMTIVSKHQQLEVEAWLENKDIGFVNLLVTKTS